MCLQELPLYSQVSQASNVPQHWAFGSQQGSKDAEIQTDFLWGMRHYRQGRFEKAQRCFKAALYHSRQAQDLKSAGKSLNGLSGIYLKTKQYDKALASSQASVSALETETPDEHYALAVYQLGVSHLRLNHLPQAEEYLEQALDLYQGWQDSLNEDHVLLHLGQVYSDRQQYLFALACYEAVLDDVLEQPQEQPMLDLLCSVLSLIAQLCKATNQPNGAAQYEYVVERRLSVEEYSRLRPFSAPTGQCANLQDQYKLMLDSIFTEDAVDNLM